MKKALILLLSIVVILLFSCDNNVYIDDSIDSPIWRVGNVYFKTADEAVSYVMKTTSSSSRALTKTDDVNRTIVLTRDVLSGESIKELGSGYEKYVAGDYLRGSITIPEGFTGSLTIDFGGHRYDFANTNEAFFVIEGGDNVYIYNGTSVIYDEASHVPYAIAVNCDTVTIDSHLIDDRRAEKDENETNRLLYVGEKGHLSVDNVKIDESGKSLSGEVAVVTDGTSGARLDINASDITITNIYTKYKNADGTEDDEISDSTAISEDAKSRINIYSGNVDIESINKKTDYYDSDTTSIFDKAYINIYSKAEDATVGGTHDVYDVVEKAIEEAVKNGTGDAALKLIHNLTHYARVEATCTKDGYEEYWHCSVCKGYFSDEGVTEIERIKILSATGHDKSGEWVTTDEDDHWKICKTCGETIDKEEHSFSLWEYNEKDEVWHRSCSVCGRAETDNHQSHRLVEHSYKDSTCTEEGNKEYWQCSVCGKCYSDKEATEEINQESTVIKKKPHTLTVHQEVEATCVSEGNIKYWTCSVCKGYFSDADGENEISEEKTVLQIDPKAHSLEHTEGKVATCTTDGNIEYWHCTRCDKYFSDESATKKIKDGKDGTILAATGHDESGEWVTTDETDHWKICKTCGETIDKEEHSFSLWEYNEKDEVWHRSCSVCGRAETDNHQSHRLVEHSYKDSTCTEEGNKEYWQCSVCGKCYSDKEATGEINQESTVIEKKPHTLTVHQEVKATCVSEGNIQYWTCSVCKGYFSDADGEDEISREETVIEIDPEAHSLEHTKGKAATCTTEGNIEYWHCTLCDKYFSDESATKEMKDGKDGTILTATGHKLAKTERKEATCTENGNIEYWYCSNCEKYFSNEEATEEIQQSETVIPHHTISDTWSWDKNNHWHECTVDGSKFDTAAHDWGDWVEEKSGTSGTVKQLYKECKVCGARMAAKEDEYLSYSIGVGELTLKNLASVPNGYFYINGEKVEDGGSVTVNGSEVTAVFKPYIDSNTEYKAYTMVINNGMREIQGEKDSEGNYTVSFTMTNRTEYTLNIQLSNEGGSRGFSCTLRKKK